MNVKSFGVGCRQLKDMKMPFTFESFQTDSRFSFMESFMKWLSAFQKSEETKGQRLTGDTYMALLQSTLVASRIIPYLFEKFQPKYILTAKFQTDQLERRFGEWRRSIGGRYLLLVGCSQVEEAEKKLRDRKIIKWKIRCFQSEGS